MRSVNNCRDRALILFQIADECPQFAAQATNLAQDLLIVADLRIMSGLVKYPKEENRAN